MKKFTENEYVINEDYCQIIIKSKKHGLIISLIDAENLKRIRMFKWVVGNNGGKLYVKASMRMENNKSKTIYLHRLIMSFPVDGVVDHADGNTLNNKKTNLRNCSIQENTTNRRKSNNKHGFKGVVYDGYRYVSRIRLNGKVYEKFGFITSKDAAEWYSDMSKKLHGNFGYSNF